MRDENVVFFLPLPDKAMNLSLYYSNCLINELSVDTVVSSITIQYLYNISIYIYNYL